MEQFHQKTKLKIEVEEGVVISWKKMRMKRKKEVRSSDGSENHKADRKAQANPKPA